MVNGNIRTGIIPPKDLVEYFNRPMGNRIMEEARYEQAINIEDDCLTVYNSFPYEKGQYGKAVYTKRQGL